ncbi:MAG: ATP-binding protein [Candidatus Bathyarchaeia archaeon]
MGEIASIKEVYFKSDHEYLEAYVEICKFLNERYEILEDTSRRCQVPPKEKEDRERALIRLEELNQAIKDAEWFFWEKVKRSKDKGIHFIFEEFADSYNLSHLEKRISLFFLCSRISRAYDLSLSKFWIIELFDIERSIAKKIGSITVFDEERPLIKSGILTPLKEWHWDDYEYKYRLNPKFLNFFCKRLEGANVLWEEIKKDIQEKIKANEVGFIKDPDYSLDDVILPDKAKEQVVFFLTTFKNGSLNKLGIDKVVKKGKGLTFLFYGPPGTGKSMLAEAVASFLSKKLLIAETSKIMSCWLGETDKNISKMFECAKANDTVLLIDEADSLLYSRNYAQAAHTVRFTNVMLTELEKFEGVAILTSNMDSLLDEAMERRIALKVKFEIPKPQLKLAEDIDFNLLANRYEFSGGYIKNAVLSALRKVAYRNSDTLTMDDLIFGAETEKQGMFNKNQKKKIIGFSNNF